MSSKAFLNALNNILSTLEETQLDAINQAAGWVADAIAADRFGVLFGSGHSHIPTVDTFPRIGGFPGWLLMSEPSTSYYSPIVGIQGLRQAIFLEKVEGYGDVIFENYRLDPKDVMIVVSNSGVNPLPVDIALNAKKQGLKTVAVTSLAHSQASPSRHSGGKRLFEVCDLVIDTGVPQGDALVEIEGLNAKVAAASTIVSSVVMQSLAAQTALNLKDRGINIPIYPSHNAQMSEAQRKEVQAMAEAVMAEYARRTSKVYK